MKKVGVTGGIGSGKTTVCNIFSALGVPVYNADQRAKWIMSKNPLVQKDICDVFGQESYIDGILNRDHIAKIVFNNQDNLMLLNSIVHPQVAIDYEVWLEQKQSYAYTIKEAALLIESKAYLELDVVIHVTAPLALKVKRIKTRDSFRALEEIKSIIAKQFTDEVRDSKSDIKIVNDDTELLLPQVLAFHHNILSKSPE